MLAILLGVPSLRSLFRAELVEQMRPPYELVNTDRNVGLNDPPLPNLSNPLDDKIVRLVAENPADYTVQLAFAVYGPDAHPRSIGLIALLGKFPREPSAYAAALRICTIEGVRIERPEEDPPATSASDPALGHLMQPSPTPSQFKEYDDVAQRGERIDPENAYFPMMRAVGLFAVRRDEMALRELKQASCDTNWNDYKSEEYDSQNQILSTLQDDSALERWATHEESFFPEMAQFRTAGRIAVNYAAFDETYGDVRSGIRIRHALMRCGHLMCVNSSSKIGSLVGNVLEHIATKSPGGLKDSKGPNGLTAAQIRAAHIRLYANYLARNNQQPEAEWVEKVLAYGDRCQQIVKTARSISPFEQPFYCWLAAWIVSISLLATILWSLGFSASVLVVEHIRNWRRAAVSILSCGLIVVWVQAYFNAEWGDGFRNMRIILADLQRAGAPSTFALPGALMSAAGPIAAAITLFLPMLSLFALVIIASKYREKSLSVAARIGQSVALLALLIYLGLTAWFVGVNASECYALDQTAHHEGPYLAQITGQAWPQ